MSKKGLALIYNAHNLLEFIWYYVKFGQDKEWDALCLPSGAKGEYMSEYCKKCGVFSKVISSEKEYISASMSEQIQSFASMFFYFVTKRRIEYCKKILNEYVDLDSYDEMVVLNDVGLFSGLMIALGKEKKVVILEDGIGDYAEKENKRILRYLLNFSEWRGFLLARMGYANCGHYYPLNTTAYCYKYNTFPEKLCYKNYKRIEKLFDFSGTDISLYESILKKTYSGLNIDAIKSSELILFTTPLKDSTINIEPYLKRTENYISKLGNGILIKKHPRDNCEYRFECKSLEEIDQTIPAEVLLPYIINKKVVFMEPSSVLLFLSGAECSIYVLYYTGLFEESKKSNHKEKLVTYPSEEKCVESIELMGVSNYKLVKI